MQIKVYLKVIDRYAKPKFTSLIREALLGAGREHWVAPSSSEFMECHRASAEGCAWDAQQDWALVVIYKCH